MMTDNDRFIIRRANERGYVDHGWLRSNHTFSFGSYFDPEYMGFGDLRVINEDRVAPGRGFGSHPHEDMEIISYVLSGGLAHKDSTGGTGVVRPGEVQVMSAGTGVVHSEFNASEDDEVHFLQIWIIPEKRGQPPRHEQRKFDWEPRRNRFVPIVSGDGRDGSLVIGQNAVIESALVEPGARVARELMTGRQGWIQVARGAVEVDGVRLNAGDAVAFAGPTEVSVAGLEESEVLFFDLLAH